jgi:hypothetical protein
MSDEAILGMGSQRLQTGAWCVAQDCVLDAVPTRSASLSQAVAPPQPAPDPVATHPPSTPRPLPAAPEWPAQTDQAAFAGVLVSAARDGTPFCEICAVAARQAAATA